MDESIRVEHLLSADRVMHGEGSVSRFFARSDACLADGQSLQRVPYAVSPYRGTVANHRQTYPCDSRAMRLRTSS